MEEISSLVSRYGLEEDREYIIIPFVADDGRMKRCFILKRSHVRIVYPNGRIMDFPLADVVEATIRRPNILLSEALEILYRELGLPPEGRTVPVKSSDQMENSADYA